MVSCSELPQIAVANILRRVRGRSIAGTSKYARVCRQWRDSQEAESLQLFVSPSNVYKDLVTGWLSMHGQCVDALVLADTGGILSWAGSIWPSLHRLKHLEVPERDSLVNLAPVLQQLPHLQHLTAEVSMDVPREIPPGTSPPPPQGACAKFITNWWDAYEWWQVPDMEELCPQLTSLHLTVYSEWGEVKVDPQLSRLLSPRLQQLTLVGPCSRAIEDVGLDAIEEGYRDAEVELSPLSLSHLSALQQLTLQGFQLGADGAQQLAQSLGALQQLRVYHTANPGLDDGLVHLAPVLTEFEGWVRHHDLDVLTCLTRLTRLVLFVDLPEGVADAVAALTGLRELGLQGDAGDPRNLVNAMGVVQQAAGMAPLRSLQLDGWGHAGEECASCLVQCTQLTSLLLPTECVDAGTWVSAVQQLTGLRCLTLPEQLVVHEQGAWLAPLTALSRLCVAELKDSKGTPWQDRYHKKAHAIAQQVQQQAVGLQHVVFWIDGDDNSAPGFAPMCWQLAPAAGVSGQVTAWLEQQEGCALGWGRPFCPCPHLPGVWELQGQAEGRPWDQVGGPRW